MIRLIPSAGVFLGFGLNNRLNHINLNNLSTKCDVNNKNSVLRTMIKRIMLILL